MIEFKNLLAKSIPERDPYLTEEDYRRAKGAATLIGHVRAVTSASLKICELLKPAIQCQFKLDDADLLRFERLSCLGAYLHDWGKANQHFQEMVYLNSAILDDEQKKLIRNKWQEHGSVQLIRHEILSGILALQVPEIHQWLSQKYDASELIIATWAAIGHHLKAGANKDGTASGDGKLTELGVGSRLWVYTDHNDFKKVLAQGSKYLGLPREIPDITAREWTRNELEKNLREMYEKFIAFESKLHNDEQILVAVVKATVIAADLAGSAVTLPDEDLSKWLTQVLQLNLESSDLQELVDQRLQGASLRPFQEEVGRTDKRVTIVRAGCGTGKTTAAYKWAKKHALGKRLFFCYPTTGTATQGYIDYAEGTSIETHLMHSRADIDRELLFSGEGEQDEGISSRLSALQTWRKKLVICTVDSVLGLMQNNRRPLCSWPALVQSAFVFDEVHSYDNRLFGALLRFLKTFRGAPVLLMSASFTPGQLQAIRQVLEDIGEEWVEVNGPQELERLERYCLHRLENDLEAWLHIQKGLELGHKILWVTNSVSSCIEIYRQAKEKFPQVQVLIYHSRFRYKDRLKKHQEVIKAFEKRGPVLAITTQVCEMSLDISADLLISAMAPAWSLIQRLGRLNRRMQSPDKEPRPAFFYPWSDPYPYKAEEMQTGEELLNALGHQSAVSQADLAAVSATLGQDTPQPVSAAWLDGKSLTYQDYLREGSYTITVLLAEDEPQIREAAIARLNKVKDKGQKLSLRQAFMQEAQAWSIPIRIPPKTDWWNWQRRGFYLVTPLGFVQYNEEEGVA